MICHLSRPAIDLSSKQPNRLLFYSPADLTAPTMNSQPSNLLDESFDDDATVDPEVMLERILADPGLVQHIVRTRSEGRENIVGYFRCPFEAGQQRHILHVPFTPSLNSTPSIEALVTEASDVRIRVTDRQKYGARIEVILPVPSLNKQSLLVEVIATSDAANTH